ncbi:MAG: endonuclease III domain-containing protein [Chloroflexota bacterium]|nr:endonuclease III domain-containing protein [Chloroflexota bacterium]
MASQVLTISSSNEVSLRMTVQSHGWVALEPWKWDEEAGELSRTDLLGEPTTITVTQSGPSTIEVRAEGSDISAVEATARRWLSLDWDPKDAIEAASAVDSEVADVIRQGGGRFLRGSNFYEDYLKTVCTVQINWAGTKRMAGRLVQEIGGGSVPTPVQVLDAGEAALRERASLGFRAKGIIVSTERLLRDGLVDESGVGAEGLLTYEALIGLHGVGPYAASHLRVLLHDFSRVPVDSEVTKFFRERHGIGPKGVEAFLERWGEYKFLGYRLSRRLGDC